MTSFNLSRWALNHQALVRYLMVVLLIGGTAAYFLLGQDEDPPFTFRAMVIRAYLPGATAQQMAEQVTDKLEKKLQEVPHADKIRSYSKPGETLIFFQLKESTPATKVAASWYQVRKKIGDIAYTLPKGVQGPFFNDEFGDTYGVIFALSAQGFSEAELKDYAEQVRQALLRVPDVDKVDFFGLQEEKIYLEISHQKLAQLGLSVDSIAQQINDQNVIQNAGTVTLPSDNLTLRVSGDLKNLEQLRALPLKAGAKAIKLGDIATISRGYADPPNNKMRVGLPLPGLTASGVSVTPLYSQEVIGLGVSMVKGGDIIRLGRNLSQAQARIEQDLPVGISLNKVADQPKAVAASVNEFLRVLIEAVLIVLLVSFLSLGLKLKPLSLDWRPGLVVTLTIPLVLAVTFLCMYIFNINLHKISLGALIIALGLLVDDAIIAVEMMVRKMEEGLDKVQAATFAYEHTAFPMLTGTLITAAGFLPIALAKSTAGEYTFSIFSVTTLALLISWIAAVIFSPYLGFLLLRVHTNKAGNSVFETPFYKSFRQLVEACITYRWWVIIITGITLVLGILAFRIIEQQFFPDSSRVEITVDLWLPEGSSYEATETEAKRFENWLNQQPEVENYITYIGIGSPRFYLPLDQQFNQLNLAQLVITPKSIGQRDALRLKINQLFQNDFPQVRGRAKLLSSGPPVPYAVQFRVQGPDASKVRALADQVKDIVRSSPYTVGVNDNWNENIKSLRFEVDQDKARVLGVSTQSIQQSLNTIFSGMTIAQFRDADRLLDMVIRSPKDQRTMLARIAQVNIPTSSGKAVPLTQLVHPEFVWEPGVIWRENRDYAVTVQSEVVDGIQGPTVTAQLEPLLEPLKDKLPASYSINVAGAAQESANAQASILVNIPLMIFIVLTLLMLQLNSFSRTVMIYLTGPLGIIGAAFMLLLLNRPFGFVAQLGVIALLGMIVRNSVILVDQIEREISSGLSPWDAIVTATVSRCRPIMLTAAAAVLAMIPLSRSIFWGPMAVAIMGGLVVATALTLLFLPALYAAWFKVKAPT